jgi:hypothetical protein
LTTCSLPVRGALGALLLVVTVGAPACGDDDRDAGKAVRASLTAVVRDFAAGDFDAVCRRMSASAKRHVGVIGHGSPTACRRDIAIVVRSVGNGQRRRLEQPMVERVEFDGQRAAAVALLGKDRVPTRIPFVEEEGRWKIDNFFGISAFPPRDG